MKFKIILLAISAMCCLLVNGQENTTEVAWHNDSVHISRIRNAIEYLHANEFPKDKFKKLTKGRKCHCKSKSLRFSIDTTLYYSALSSFERSKPFFIKGFTNKSITELNALNEGNGCLRIYASPSYEDFLVLDIGTSCQSISDTRNFFVRIIFVFDDEQIVDVDFARIIFM